MSLALTDEGESGAGKPVLPHSEIIGGLAQLVERLLCKQDVSGSSPLTSTDPNPDDSDWSCGRNQDEPKGVT